MASDRSLPRYSNFALPAVASLRFYIAANIDEWLRDLLDHAQAREMLDILDDRYRTGSTIFCSQLPETEWHARIDDQTIADAILDRIVHDSMRIELDGQSMRKKTSTIASDKASLRSDQIK